MPGKKGACHLVRPSSPRALTPIEIEPSGCDSPVGPLPSDSLLVPGPAIPSCLSFEPNSYLLRYFGSGAGTLVPAPINKLTHIIITP